MSLYSGFVSLVGAGPGDPELLTLGALRRIERADVVLYDRLVSPEILALANSEAEFIYCGKDEGHQEAMQQEIFFLLAARAQAGKRVVRLKGGDPFLFGRGAEEVEHLREFGIDAEVIPGVSSSLATPALAGVPLTYRGVATSVTIVSGRCQGGKLADWKKVASVDTLVILMGVKYRDRIAAALIECGRPANQPVAFIERGSTPEERVTITTLAAVARGEVEVEAPAVFVAGEVVNHRVKLNRQAKLARIASTIASGKVAVDLA